MTEGDLRPNPTRRIELSDAWRAERDRALDPAFVHEPWCRGHGWMLDDGFADILAPVVYSDEFGDSSFHRFTSMGADVAARLLEPLGEGYLATERHNDGPTIGAVLRVVASNPDRLRAHGYIIGPGRCDERISVEGVLARTDRDYRLCSVYGRRLDDCDCDELYAWLRTEFSLDALRFPHELDQWRGYESAPGGYTGGSWYRAWWD